MATYSLGPVKPWVATAAQELGDRFGLKTIGGYRTGDQYDHPKGLALDMMINNIANGTQVGQQLAEYAWANRDKYGLTYVIWNRKVISTKHPTKWEDYTGDSPHTDHVHLSFASKAPKGGGLGGGSNDGGATQWLDGIREDYLGVPGGDLVGAINYIGAGLTRAAGGVDALGQLARKMLWLALPTSQVRIVSGILGVLLIAAGIVFIGKQVKA